MQHQQFRLKDSIYVLEEPTLGLYVCLNRAGAAHNPPRLKPLPLATMAPATPYCRALLAAAGTALGQPHELVRIDG